MTTFARDCSNFTITFTPELLQAWKAQGVGLIICQAFPPSYSAKYAEQRQQMRLCAQEGMPFDCYVYDYLADPTWLDAALQGISQAQTEDGLAPRKRWLDEEDVETEAGWTAQQRLDAIQRSVDRAGPCGIYTGGWWWGLKTGNSPLFRGLPLWAAQYDGIADASVFTPIGGWASCRIKQYAGSQPDGTDLNVLSAEEEAELTGGQQPVDDAERQQMQNTIDGLVGSLGYIAGDLLAPVAKQKVASKAVQQLVAGIRNQAEQHNIQHA